jgi:hypothetical protein
MIRILLMRYHVFQYASMTTRCYIFLVTVHYNDKVGKFMRFCLLSITCYGDDSVIHFIRCGVISPVATGNVKVLCIRVTAGTHMHSNSSPGPVVVLPVLLEGLQSRSGRSMTGFGTSGGGRLARPMLLLPPAAQWEQRVFVVAVILLDRLHRSREHLQTEPRVRPSSAGLVMLHGVGHAPVAGAFV